MALYTQVAKMDLRQHVQQAQVTRDAAAPTKRGVGDGEKKIALVSLTGTLTKRPASLSDDTSSVEARRQIRAARRDGEVVGLMLHLDSPGGTVAGTPDLADEVAAAAQEMPVTAFVEDLTASAAYWVASQATRVVANHRTAMVGSIGTFMGLYDLSAAAGQMGMKPVLISSGGVKGMGFPGTEITEAHKQMLQSLVNETQSAFNAAIQRGRNMSQARVEQLADGQVHTADQAMQLGLIDAIQSFDDALAELKGSARGRSSSRRSDQSNQTGAQVMSDSQQGNAAPVVTVKQLKEKFPHNTAEDREHCLEQSMTLEQAAEYMNGQLAARLESREEELENLNHLLKGSL
jgi:signal peptide peptidase SppA